MASISSLQASYENLDCRMELRTEEAIDPTVLLAFDYEYSHRGTQVGIDTDEFTALCPWTGLPDYGTLTITYEPGELCIELKSLKYYLLCYRDVGIVQEHAVNRILDDLVEVCHPHWMKVELDYKVRGGLHTAVVAEYKANDLTDTLPESSTGDVG